MTGSSGETRHRYRLQVEASSLRRAPHDLNAAQQEAAETDAARSLILAGAGTGKTRTLTHRIVHLVDRGVAPESIALVTFTQKAAFEMHTRIAALLGDAAGALHTGTFHRLALRILSTWAEALGYAPGFTVLDREDQLDLLAAALGDANLDPSARRVPKPQTLAAALSLAINTRTPIEQIVAQRYPELGSHGSSLALIYEAYIKRKVLSNAMDFDDLLAHLHGLLNLPAFVARVRGPIRHVLVDEFQDTSRIQIEIAEALAAEGTLTVVGDDAQSIYSFRGAYPDAIPEFISARPTRIFRLVENYRSTSQILAIANLSLTENPRQLTKPLLSRTSPGVPPVVVPARDPEQQAKFVVQRVLELCEQGVPLSSQAVLYRAHTHCLELELELTRQKIPYKVRSGPRFLEQAHIKDVIAHLRVIANPDDRLAWLRMLKLQPQVGAQSAERIAVALEATQTFGKPAAARLHAVADLAELPTRARATLAALVKRLESYARHADAQRIGALIRAVLNGDGTSDPGTYRGVLELTYNDAQERAGDIERLAELADQAKDLADFLAELALGDSLTASTQATHSQVLPEESLMLTTIHQAKGLEWAVVFILGLTEGSFPITSALEEAGGEDEERRLFYVAVTRARRELYLLTPVSRLLRNGQRMLVRTSRFLSEIERQPALFERWVLDVP